MIILGEKYKFTDLELKRLNKKFNDMQTIIYKDKTPVDVISDIEIGLNSNSVKVIVLNTKVKVNDEIIKYLTNLKYSDMYNKVKIISIEHFLEQYLFKCYIPESNDDLHDNGVRPYLSASSYHYLLVFQLSFLVGFLSFYSLISLVVY